jgi:hypothetical protein
MANQIVIDSLKNPIQAVQSKIFNPNFISDASTSV